ncbi:relaxase/mobilization nuclease domain-containing protein [Pseudomonas sp. PS01297]|uniref:relaxase/mobilization nuclease domain-containing protein n=1 Tax=Pseudomonas sp. PS01297 TaxID=2991433 RepID=UPI00249BAA42|nr:relaxase/mobilization nuclease domain-containing protein [Pseudomonas sp. PS01297]
MINTMKMRTGGGNRTRSSANYLLKTNPEGDAIDCTIPRLNGESNMEYATRIKNVFEGDRVHNQKKLYQFNALALHPSEGDKFTDAQMIEMAKEVYLKNGVKNSLNDNRHYLFVVERDKDHHHVHAMIHLTDLTTKKVNNKMIDYNPIIKKLELKYGLYNEHRKPKDEDEYKKTFKKELKSIQDNALNASEFLMLANVAGFEINHNGNEAYSLTKDGQTFKASDLGMSYKLLKKALGDDPEFAATLASLHNKKAGNGGFGSIGGDFHDEQSAITEKRIKKSNRVVDTRFDTTDGHDFFFKNSTKKAFEYSALTGKATFNTNSPMAIKAGLQKLTENGKPHTLHLNGSDTFKRQAWLQFHMMNLDKKGYSLKGYKATEKDKAELEKMELENQAFKKPIEDNNIKALPTDKPADKSQENSQFKDGAGKAIDKTKQVAASVVQVGTGLAINSGLMAGIDILTSSEQLYKIDQMAAKIKADYEAEENARQSARTSAKRSRGIKFTPK